MKNMKNAVDMMNLQDTQEKRGMRKKTRTANRTKLWLTATMCAAIIVGSTACNNNEGTNNMNNNNNNNMPSATDDGIVPEESVMPG